MVKVKGYLACLLFVPFALDTSHTNHCRVCQERWRSVFCHLSSKLCFFCCFHRTFYITYFLTVRRTRFSSLLPTVSRNSFSKFRFASSIVIGFPSPNTFIKSSTAILS